MANEVLKGSIFVDGVLSDLCGKRPFLAESTVGAWYYIKSVFFSIHLVHNLPELR